MSRSSYANVAATLALVLAIAGGTAYAAQQYVITSTKQIAPSMLKRPRRPRQQRRRGYERQQRRERQERLGRSDRADRDRWQQRHGGCHRPGRRDRGHRLISIPTFELLFGFQAS